MKSKAALLMEIPGKWEVVEVDIDEPKANEVLLRNVATGLCHSDEHHATGDSERQHLPYCGGHEGSAIVEAVGPGVTSVKPGDHVVTAFVPGCGRCRSCARGMQNLCDLGALIPTGAMLDGTHRMHFDGQDVAQACFLGTFSQMSVVPERCCIPIGKDIPLTAAAFLGCCVPTGWGSAVNAGEVAPGDVVIVMGTGGLGLNAVQGAHHAGAARVIAADPIEFRRNSALSFGATDAVASIDEAADLARSLTGGQGADVAIITTSLLKGEYMAQAFNSIRKAGTLVVTAVPGRDAGTAMLDLIQFPIFQKRIQGCLYGAMSPTTAVPLLADLYRAGRLKLDELANRTFTLDEINDGWDAMYDGSSLRGVVLHDAL
ncbi:NDMA-dependent alcohol dehydrogenase [Gordonia sp. zg691]|uniref:alcohol dehydrogenase n=1 Tax=Gordonia jinghuaiqii TaxID=2758710 RepID=A0A7D7QWC8_9ACTN|nr:NDMA-dependent alcohol dehydrogenase [Gordonia jinghuaiqii]MBD0863464.1 NDMA-dependent alcohol dehydrogenase [Gordonia jinghuaiqii]MCR5979195.1 NDMA-dependent alcohol dehydrogenase [Gordonia jinghuaiqii]QMT00989.1 NDMA-dependent alcohol dehydrogenase [Gordonia jinghuaiqii]